MTAGTDDSARLRRLYELGCAFAARLDLGELNALVLQQCRDVLRAEGPRHSGESGPHCPKAWPDAFR